MNRSREFRIELQMPVSRQCEVQISFAGKPTSEAMNMLIEYVKLMKQTYQEEEAREEEAREEEAREEEAREEEDREEEDREAKAQEPEA